MDSSDFHFDKSGTTTNVDLENNAPDENLAPPTVVGSLKDDNANSISPQVDSSIEHELDRADMAARLMSHIAAQTINTPFHVSADTSLFCYGSLMDAEVLQAVLDLRELPAMRDGWVEGYAIKKWGIYPTVVPREGSRIYGKVWKIVLPPYMNRLAEYETEAYRPENCEIELTDGGRITDGRVFIWSGVLEDNQLHDGEFDLGWYQAYFKPAMIRSWKQQKQEEERRSRFF